MAGRYCRTLRQPPTQRISLLQVNHVTYNTTSYIMTLIIASILFAVLISLNSGMQVCSFENLHITYCCVLPRMKYNNRNVIRTTRRYILPHADCSHQKCSMLFKGSINILTRWCSFAISVCHYYLHQHFAGQELAGEAEIT